MKLIKALLGLLLICEPVWAEPDYNRLADAIHIAENGHRLDKGEQYGIHSVHYRDEAEARQICLRTCRRAYKRFKSHGGAINGLKSFITELSKRYCPVNSRVWARNVYSIYQKGA